MNQKVDSQLIGRRNKRIHKLLAWSVNFINAWLEAGKMVPQGDGSIVKYDEIDVTPAELKFLRGQWMRVKKWRDAYCEDVKAVRELTRLGKSFYRDASADLELVKKAVDTFAPDLSHTDKLRVETYILAAMLNDFVAVTGGTRNRNLKMWIQTTCTLADHIIPVDSPLVLPLNQVYWAVRDEILCDPEWPAEYYDLTRYTAQEDYISKPVNRRENEAARKLYAWRWNTPAMKKEAAA